MHKQIRQQAPSAAPRPARTGATDKEEENECEKGISRAEGIHLSPGHFSSSTCTLRASYRKLI